MRSRICATFLGWDRKGKWPALSSNTCRMERILFLIMVRCRVIVIARSSRVAMTNLRMRPYRSLVRVTGSMIGLKASAKRWFSKSCCTWAGQSAQKTGIRLPGLRVIDTLSWEKTKLGPNWLALSVALRAPADSPFWGMKAAIIPDTQLISG